MHACCVLNHIWLFMTPWTVAHQDPLSVEFSSKNTGVGCHFLLQEIFPTWEHFFRNLSLVSSVLVSQDFCNKVPQIGWLRITEFDCLSSGGYKCEAKMASGPGSCWDLRGTSCLLLVSAGCWLRLAVGTSLPSQSPASPGVFLLCGRVSEFLSCVFKLCIYLSCSTS